MNKLKADKNNERLIKVEITYEETRRVSFVREMTQSQIDQMNNGINVWEHDCEKEIENGTIETDYYVEDWETGRCLVDWELP